MRVVAWLLEGATPLRGQAQTPVIYATDHQIDRLVYELYGLTEEELKIVEG
ncbi:MAG: hypothetical protein NTX36_05040 [Proteobacteria bacterium]|nr:hypothetical protein [Pseudomonadota bacterium]